MGSIVNVVRFCMAEPSSTAKVLSRLLALALTMGWRRLDARFRWSPSLTYRLNLVRHPAHVRLGVPAEAVGCFCDRRRPSTLRRVA